MNETAKLNRAIRINVVGGAVILAVTAFTLLLVVVGTLPLDARVLMSLVFGFAIGGISFLTARSMRQDRDDPAGVERRFQSQAVAWSAGLLAVGLIAVVGILVWGLLR